MSTRTQTQSTASGTVSSALIDTIEATGLGSYVGYHIAITAGTGSGQIRYAHTSAGRTDTLNLSQPWDTIPDGTSTFHVAWNQDDWDSNFGNDFKLVLKATQEWDVGANGWIIGDGTNPAVGAVTDQAFSMDEYLEVTNNSYVAIGYLFGEPPESDTSLGGWYFNSNNGTSTLGYQHIRVDTGGTLNMYGVNCGTVYSHAIIAQSSSYVHLYDCAFTNLARDGSRLKGYTYGENIKFQISSANSSDYLVVASGFSNYTGPVTLSNMYGFQSSATDEIIRVNKYISVNAQVDVVANNSTTWEFVNPSWTVPTITWTQSTGQSQVYEIFTVNSDIKTTAGSAIVSSVFAIIEGSTNSWTTPNLAITDASGTISEEILKRHWPSTNASTTYGPFIARSWRYGFDPFGGALTVDTAIELPIAMGEDTEITEVTAASALTYSDIQIFDWSSAASDGKLTVVQYSSAGNGVFVVSTIVSTQSGAHGTVREYIGDATEGVVVLAFRSGGIIADSSALYVGGVIKGYATSTFNEDYTWEVYANNNALAAVYDFTTAKMATTSASYEYYVSALRQRSTNIIYSVGGAYHTDSVASTGVWISKGGTGIINYLESDSGTQYIPPTQYTFELTGLPTDTEIRVYNVSDDSEITGTESSGTTFSYTYTYGGDINAYVVIFHLNYNARPPLNVTLSNANQSIPIQMIPDRVYSNP